MWGTHTAKQRFKNNMVPSWSSDLSISQEHRWNIYPLVPYSEKWSSGTDHLIWGVFCKHASSEVAGRETQLSATRSPWNYTSNTDWWGRPVDPKCGSWTTASPSPGEPVKDAHVWASSETWWVLETLGWTQQSLLSSPSASEEHLHWRSNGDKDSSNKNQKAIPREEGVNTEAPTDLIFSFWKRLQPKLIVVITTLLPKRKGPFFFNCLSLTLYRIGYHLKHRNETLHPALFFLTMPTVPGTPLRRPKIQSLS